VDKWTGSSTSRRRAPAVWSGC